MAFKRKFGRKNTQRKMGVKGRKPMSKKRKGVTLASVAKRLRVISKTIETKSGSQLVSDNIAFQHNNFKMVSNTFLRTSPGTLDNENSQGQRIGDKVTLSGVAFKMMIELDERFSDVILLLETVQSPRFDLRKE